MSPSEKGEPVKKDEARALKQDDFDGIVKNLNPALNSK
jgi:hypothetical protein